MKAIPDIRPIDTLHNGYRFRSRLEARWAVFFDHCREQYIYEHEGFRLPSGPYLPDFFFPVRHGFIEVKPANQLLPTRCFEFGLLRSWCPISEEFPREILLAVELSRFLKCEAVIVYGDPLAVLNLDDGGAVCFSKDGLRANIGFIDLFGPIYTAADAARAARFEHK